MKSLLSMLGLLLLAVAPAASYARTHEPQTKNTAMKTDRKVLVAYFSRAGENYAVGDIARGNTRIVAEMIADATGGRLFEIVPRTEYPRSYDACVEVAKREQEAGARPAIREDIAIEDYDVVFLGYPNWWGDMPMPVYTFIEQHDWSHKIVLPFCTHEGSGLSDTQRRIAAACEGATVGAGLALRGAAAQHSQPQVRKTVASWLEKTDY